MLSTEFSICIKFISINIYHRNIINGIVRNCRLANRRRNKPSPTQATDLPACHLPLDSELPRAPPAAAAAGTAAFD